VGYRKRGGDGDDEELGEVGGTYVIVTVMGGLFEGM